MRPFKRVKMLNADEYRVIKRPVRSRKIAAGKVRRAKIILLSNQGLTAREIAAELDCNERTALKWIGRFKRHGVTGLEEVLRSGRPRVYGPEDVGAVIQAALTPPSAPPSAAATRAAIRPFARAAGRRSGPARGERAGRRDESRGE